MPIEIRELVIRANVDDSVPQNQGSRSQQGNNIPARNDILQEIVHDSILRILEKMKDKNER